jgi:hypothetical protein
VDSVEVDVFSPLRGDAGTRIFRIRLITGIFSFFNFLMAGGLGISPPFY